MQSHSEATVVLGLQDSAVACGFMLLLDLLPWSVAQDPQATGSANLRLRRESSAPGHRQQVWGGEECQLESQLDSVVSFLTESRVAEIGVDCSNRASSV